MQRMKDLHILSPKWEVFTESLPPLQNSGNSKVEKAEKKVRQRDMEDTKKIRHSESTC